MASAQTNAEAFRRAFGETCDPDAHVARAATEAILDRMAAWSGSDGVGSTLAALVAPPGLGKSHLLRVLESRLRRAAEVRSDGTAPDATPCRSPRTLYLPYAALPLPDLVRWIRGLAGVGPEPGDARLAGEEAGLRSLAELAGGPGRPLQLLIDDADSMPASTLRALAQGLEREHSPIRIVLALGDDSRAVRMLAALDGLEPLELFLRDPLDAAETEAYLQSRLARVGLGGEALDGLDGRTVARVHALSGGVPRRIHRVVLALVEPDRSALARALTATSRTDAWLGRPIEDGF